MPQEPSVAPKSNSAKFWPAFLLAIFLGWLGAHRFYLKSPYRALMLITLGGFGLWALIDALLILIGKFKDEKGQAITNPHPRFSWAVLIVWLIFVLNNGGTGGSAGDPLSPSKFDEKMVYAKLTGTFYDHGRIVDNPRYGKILGQEAVLDFSNYIYYISISPDGSAMTIVEGKDALYDGIPLPRRISMENTSYHIENKTVRIGENDVEVWTITFADKPIGFPEHELIICSKGFRTISNLFGTYNFTKKDSTILKNRSEVAKYFGMDE